MKERSAQNKHSGQNDGWLAAESRQRAFRVENAGEPKRRNDQDRCQVDAEPLCKKQNNRPRQNNQQIDLIQLNTIRHSKDFLMQLIRIKQVSGLRRGSDTWII